MNIPWKLIGSWKTILLSFCILVPFQVKVAILSAVFSHPFFAILARSEISKPILCLSSSERGERMVLGGGGSRTVDGEKIVHHLWCPKRFWNWNKNSISGIISGAWFFHQQYVLCQQHHFHHHHNPAKLFHLRLLNFNKGYQLRRLQYMSSKAWGC